MNKMVKKLSVGMLGLTLCGTVLPIVNSGNVFAEEYKKFELRELTEDEVTLIDRFVAIENGKFILIENDILSPELLFLAEHYVEKSNKVIESCDDLISLGYEKTFVTPGLLTRSFGKNDVEVHWNYYRVYLDRDAARNAFRTGCTVGALVIPSVVAKGALSVLGIWGPSFINDGVWFDVNIFLLPLNNVLPLVAITNRGWQ